MLEARTDRIIAVRVLSDQLNTPAAHVLSDQDFAALIIISFD